MSSLSDRLKALRKAKEKKEKTKVKAKKSVSKTKVKSKKSASKNKFKPGKATIATKTNNCLACMHWAKCSKPTTEKGINNACSSIQLYPVKKGSAYSDKNINLILNKTSDLDAGLNKEERAISALISRTLKGSGVTAADARLDDRDLPTAPNFVTWMTDNKFAGNLVQPWAKQIEHPTKLLAEWCPNKRCTDLEYWESVPVDATVEEIQDRVTFLEFGICPKCGGRKSDFTRNGLLKPYNALAGLAGQRLAKCIAVQHTVLVPKRGLLRMSEILDDNNHTEADTAKSVEGLCLYNRHNQPQKVSNTYNSGKKESLCINTTTGDIITSYEHPLWVVGKGFVQAQNIKAGDKLHIVAGQQTFGDKSIGKPLASALGWFVAEGCIIYHEGKIKGATITQDKLDKITSVFSRAGFSIKKFMPKYRTAFLKLSKKDAERIHHMLHTKQALTTAKDGKNKQLRSYNVNIPRCIREAPKREVVAFLRALYAGDGYIGTADSCVGYTTVSRQLARDLVDMLMNFGIVPIVSKKPCDGRLATTSIAYNIVISADMVTKFNDEIGFDDDTKQAALDFICQQVRSYSHGTHTHYGFSLQADLSRVTLPPRTICGVRKDRQVSKDMLQRIAEHATNTVSEHIDFAIKDHVYVTEVRSVEPEGERYLADVTVPNGHEFIACGVINHNTFTACAVTCYDLHRLLKSQNPQAMFGIPTSQVLTGTFAALTFDQAKNMVWSNMYNMMSDGAWFQQYVAAIKSQSHQLGIEEAITITNTYARFRHRNLFYLCSGPSKRTMRGATRSAGMVDEIGWFINKLKSGKAGDDPERLDAKGVHDALDRSLGTVRNGAYNLLMSGGNENVSMGYLLEVSSPQSKTDMIMKRYEASRGSLTIYGYRMATWEGNPTITRHSPFIEEAFREDPIAAMRDWGAVPPVSGSPFLKLSSLRNVFSTKRENAGRLKTTRVVNRAGQQQTSGSIKKLKPHSGEPSVLAIDAGYVNNSFAFSIHYASEKTGRVIVPFLGEIFPSPEAPIHFPDVCDGVMAQLIEHFNVGLVISDRWQNIMLLQTLAEEHDIGFASRSLSYADFDTFRQTAIYDGALLLPMLENKPKHAIRMAGNPGYPMMFNNQPLSHLVYQFVAVNDVPNVTVSKPDGGTDDLFRSVVLGFTAITDADYAEFFENGSRPQQSGLGAVMHSQGMGGGASISNNIGVAVGPRSSLGGGSSNMGVVSSR